MRYRRMYVSGGSYFFTVVTQGRRPVFSSPDVVALLRETMRLVRQEHPFTVDAMVVLPDHLHCIWTLPPHDMDYSLRWRLLKSSFSRQFGKRYGAAQAKIWQQRYWEHLIRDALDLSRHIDYIHYNPVKHGYVSTPVEWPYSSLHKYIHEGIFSSDWGAGEIPCGIDAIGRE